MKKIATKFVLIAAATFITGSVMAQTDTTESPVPVPTDTAQVPEPPAPEPEPVPTDSTSLNNSTASLAIQFTNFTNRFYAITNKELRNSKSFAIKTEEDTEA